MAKRFIIKRRQDSRPSLRPSHALTENKEQNTEEMGISTQDKVAIAMEMLKAEPQSQIKRIKKDKGLIERTESSKTILTEDNKELLID